jgi:hypothetical protein
MGSTLGFAAEAGRSSRGFIRCNADVALVFFVGMLFVVGAEFGGLLVHATGTYSVAQ